MITLILPREQHRLLTATLRKAGRREVGGILMGEHVGPNIFAVREMTVHRRGGLSSFVRRIGDAIGNLRSFFRESGYDYERFNYIGEWHSHPSFSPYPSRTDDLSMLQIVQDEAVGANFVVLLIAKLGVEGELVSTAHTYLPEGARILSIIKVER
ncbi:Mov34/MPN/PAD-1 family protein [Brenneria rubrifaciens]|uniref:Mov34/MPN/PAD-1 family protein n=1 Tax=Brenneria rubrifaciens TaxID=55213 RepID=UPI0015866202|nr:Mov34/MPN/PAD-1 family protein [Brenneria rubrifaciens]